MNKRFKFLILLLMIPVMVFAEGRIKIILKNSAVVFESKVYLKKISEISGEDDELIEKLRNIEIATAPKPGIERVLTSDFITSRLKQNQVEKELYFLSGSNSVVVTTKYTVIHAPAFRQCVNEYLEKNICGDADKSIQFSRVPENVMVPEKDVNLRVFDKQYGNFKGMLNIQVGIYNGNQLFKRVNIPGRVRIFEDIVVADRNIKRHEIILFSDMKLKKMETTMFGDRYFKNINSLVGKRSKATLKKGMVVKPHMIEEPPVIKRGEVVTIKSISGSVEILANGTAREDGWKGKVIRVYCTSTKKDVLAEVVKPGVVVLK